MSQDIHHYEDILYLPRPKSYRKKMSIENRAAQFAPFVALTGHKEAVLETERRTVRPIQLDEDRKQQINQILLEILYHIEKHPCIKVIYYQKDLKKTGGNYLVYQGRVKKYDEYTKSLIFENQFILKCNHIYQIEML